MKRDVSGACSQEVNARLGEEWPVPAGHSVPQEPAPGGNAPEEPLCRVARLEGTMVRHPVRTP